MMDRPTSPRNGLGDAVSWRNFALGGRMVKRWGALIFLGVFCLLLFRTQHVKNLFRPQSHKDSIEIADLHSCAHGPAGSWTPSIELERWSNQARDPRDVSSLSSLWNSLTDLFHSHPPHPARTIRPTVSRPSASQVEFFTTEMADSHLHMDDKQALKTREAHQAVINGFPPYHESAHLFGGGKGIVILAGGRYAGYAAISIDVLRQQGSDMPVEVWVKDESEEDLAWTEDLVQRGAVVRRLSDYARVGSTMDWIDPFKWFGKPVPWSPYQLKAMVMLFSSFDEILFLDADCIPVQDPAFLLHSSAYLEHGAIFWPDLWPSIASLRLPYLIGLSNSSSELMWHQQTAESGQMVINKRRHWHGLLLSCYYNYYGPGFWYTATIGNGQGWGDKDTYLIALQALREQFFIVPRRPTRLMATDSEMPVINLQFYPEIATHHDSSLISTDSSVPEPSIEYDPVFAHSCGGVKWSLDDFAENYESTSLWSLFKSLYDSRYAYINSLLHESRRLLAKRPEWPDLDVEFLLWKGLEHTACWNKAMGSVSRCAWTRTRTLRVFGHDIPENGTVHAC